MCLAEATSARRLWKGQLSTTASYLESSTQVCHMHFHVVCVNLTDLAELNFQDCLFDAGSRFLMGNCSLLASCLAVLSAT